MSIFNLFITEYTKNSLIRDANVNSALTRAATCAGNDLGFCTTQLGFIHISSMEFSATITQTIGTLNSSSSQRSSLNASASLALKNPKLGLSQSSA